MADIKPPTPRPSAFKPPAPKPAGNILPEIIAVALVLILAVPLLNGVISLISGGVVGGFVGAIFSFLKTLATLISMIALVIVVYSFIRITEISKEQTKKLGLALNWHTERKQKNDRWERVEQYMLSANSSDWKIAILEADNILDDIVERMGYKGATLGERMKMIEASDFPYLEDAWQAHKLRNALAHKGTNYELARSDAEQAINIYHRVFKELGYL